MSTKKGLLLPELHVKLTKTEKEIYRLLTEEYLTKPQIAIRRNCTRQAVHNIFKSLVKKGAIKFGLQQVDNSQSTSQLNNHKRLHGQEWNIRILWQDHNYQRRLSKCNLLLIEGHTIRLYRKSIEIYSGEGVSFYGETEQKATANSLIYWQRFFRRLENELGIIFIKQRSSNIRLVNQHYGTMESELTKDCLSKGQRIRIYAKEDRKLWFSMDNSFNLKESECLHPETGKQDSEIISKHLDDWREHPDSPTSSELATNVNNLVMGFDNYGKHIESHIHAIQELGLGIRELRDLLKQQGGKKD